MASVSCEPPAAAATPSAHHVARSLGNLELSEDALNLRCGCVVGGAA